MSYADDHQLQALARLASHPDFRTMLDLVAEQERYHTVQCINQRDETELRISQGKAQLAGTLTKILTEARLTLQHRDDQQHGQDVNMF